MLRSLVSSIILGGLGLVAASGLASSARAQGAGVPLDADTCRIFLADQSTANGARLLVDGGTIGKYYAAHTQPYHPLVRVSVPAEWDGATVWVRQRGGPFQIKGDNGKIELDWKWDAPTAWQWKRYGTYSREQLTTTFIIIRSDTLAPDGGIDAIALLREDLPVAEADFDLLARQTAAAAQSPAK
jgi:hypothetical protein